ncbi:Thioredoxin-like protein 1 [Babesia bigemina]|uniref:Thioredoxin-like protein 1 n=1 Tax=Babesia bigemina TaxID=5866 RepID=A0A061DD80_BABBI|nr:Thioredoxin-like protein 1 [Babesia bigemina]CDR96035.1 Thioredoxin-like protein 1 [Babesia bigemina]|eukprot:XP_012768221.1 Thioredoxin-like protein 1 [Babesia bigemina]
MVQSRAGPFNGRMLWRNELNRLFRQGRTGGCEPVNLAVVGRCIDYTTSTALNALDGYGKLSEVLVSTSPNTPPMVSDVDEQLILKVFFLDPVSIVSIQLCCDAPPDDLEASKPKTVRLYTNRTEFDFSESDSVIPQHEIVLNEVSVGEKQTLKGTKFDRVTSLQIFIVDNLEGKERTYLQRLILMGTVHRPYPDR